MSDRPSQKIWRRWLRLSVRGLMILVLILGGGLGWIVHRAKTQRVAVAAIEKAGGWVRYDWESGKFTFLPEWRADVATLARGPLRHRLLRKCCVC